jgi:hypothetical protein
MHDDDERTFDDAVLMSTAVRTYDGDTLPLTREGSLVHRNNTMLVVELVGVDPHSAVVVNDGRFDADEFGRVSFVVENTSELNVSFVNDNVSHSVVQTTAMQSPSPFLDSSLGSFVLVACACAIAWRIPMYRQRR